jgi:two-component sensor histidine kinase
MPEQAPSAGTVNAEPLSEPLRDVVCEDCPHLVEADHRIANHFALLAGYVALKRAEMIHVMTPPADPVVLTIMDSIAVQITMMSRLHRTLSRDPFDGIIDVSRYLGEACDPFRHGLSGLVSLTSAFKPDCLVSIKHVLPITQIMVEIITNSLKHAHGAREPGKISASCMMDPFGTFTLEVCDDGNGLPATFDPMGDKGLGFRIVRGLSKQIGAAINYVSTDNGITFRLNLPALSVA